MKKLKVAVIGAGSTYTPELVQGFITRRDRLEIGSLYMMDIDPEKTAVVTGLARRMFAAAGLDPRVVITSDLEEAVAGADYVLGQVRVGGLEARIRDEKIPLKYGLLGQETTGVGGFMNALRTIPVLMRVAGAIERLAPQARLINFSNPSGIIAEALLNHTGVHMTGLCNGPINMIRDARRRIPEGTGMFDYDFIGLNHLCWITGLHADGKEILQDQLSGKTSVPHPENLPPPPFDEALLRIVRALPCSYLQYFYHREDRVKKGLAAARTRGEECVEIEAQLLEMYRDPTLKEKPALLDKRGGAMYSEAAVSLIDAMENDKGEIHVVDVKNQGAYEFMDWDDVVEVKCRVDKTGATPLRLPPLDNPHIIALMRTVKAYEKLAVKAGLTGDRSAALEALLVHPLVGDFSKASAVLDEMLEANRAYLPRFFGRD